MSDDRVVRDRVEKEKQELDGRLEKLRTFLCSDAVEEIDSEQHALLMEQECVMEEYSIILQRRIERFDTCLALS